MNNNLARKDEMPVNELDTSLLECDQLTSLIMSGRLDELIELSSAKPSCMFHSYAKAIGLSMAAMMVIERPKLKVAMRALNEAVTLVNPKRRKTGWSGYLVTPNYKDYSEEELHAELLYAELMQMSAGVTVLSDQSFMAFVNGALYVKSCHSAFKECLAMLNSYQGWSSDRSRNSFEARTTLGTALFNLLLSYLPGKFLKLIEYVGFSGNREYALQMMKRSIAASKDDLSLPLSSLILVHYYCFTEYAFGLGDVDTEAVGQLIKNVLIKYPNTSGSAYLSAMHRASLGELEEARALLRSSLNGPNHDLIEIPCHHFLYWINVFLCNWEEAALEMRAIRDSNWSRAAFHFNEAAAWVVALDEGADIEEKGVDTEYILSLLTKVGTLKKNFGGKHAFHEKFVLVKAAKHSSNLDGFLFPPFEKAYIYNFFSLYAKKPDVIKRIKEKFDRKLKQIEQTDSSSSSYHDKVVFLTFFKGICHKQLMQFEEAMTCFERVIELEHQVTENTHFPPQAAYEIGSIYRLTKDYRSAVSWLKKSKSYDGHFTEMMVKFKVQLALDALKKEMKK